MLELVCCLLLAATCLVAVLEGWRAAILGWLLALVGPVIVWTLFMLMACKFTLRMVCKLIKLFVKLDVATENLYTELKETEEAL